MFLRRNGQTLGLSVGLLALTMVSTPTRAALTKCEGRIYEPTFPHELGLIIEETQDVAGSARLLTRLQARYEEVRAHVRAAFLTTPNVTAVLGPIDRLHEELRTAQVVSRFLSGVRGSTPELQEIQARLQTQLASMIAQLSQDAEVQRWVEVLSPASEFEAALRAGLRHKFGPALSSSARERQLEVAQQQALAATEFKRILDQDQRTIPVVAAEFPDELRAAVEPYRRGDTVHLPIFSASLVRRCLAVCPSESVRRAIYLAYRSRASENARHALDFAHASARLAQGLNHQSWTEYRLSAGSLMGSPRELEEFLVDFQVQVRGAVNAVLQRMRRLKEVDSPGAPLAPWDVYYYERLAREGDGEPVDRIDEFPNYFPALEFHERLMNFVAEMFGLRFERVEESSLPHPSLWLYRVWDSDSRKFIGHVILDLFTRDHKNPDSQAVEELIARADIPGLGATHPVSVLVMNLGPWEGREEIALDPDTVVTVGHEYLHLLQTLLQKGKAGSLSGFRLATDFAEVPSTFMELVLSDPDVLIHLSGRPGDPRQKLPREVAESASRSLQRIGLLEGTLFSGSHLLPRVVLSSLDFEIQRAAARGTSVAELQGLYHDALRSFFGFEDRLLRVEDNLIATFTHGVDVEYHGQYWSYDVAWAVAQKIARRFGELGGFGNPEPYRRFRSLILELARGEGSPRERVEEFLTEPLSASPIFPETRF